jgi:hypothetical protein
MTDHSTEKNLTVNRAEGKRTDFGRGSIGDFFIERPRRNHDTEKH